MSTSLIFSEEEINAIITTVPTVTVPLPTFVTSTTSSTSTTTVGCCHTTCHMESTDVATPVNDFVELDGATPAHKSTALVTPVTDVAIPDVPTPDQESTPVITSFTDVVESDVPTPDQESTTVITSFTDVVESDVPTPEQESTSLITSVTDVVVPDVATPEHSIVARSDSDHSSLSFTSVTSGTSPTTSSPKQEEIRSPLVSPINASSGLRRDRPPTPPPRTIYQLSKSLPSINLSDEVEDEDLMKRELELVKKILLTVCHKYDALFKKTQADIYTMGSNVEHYVNTEIAGLKDCVKSQKDHVENYVNTEVAELKKSVESQRDQVEKFVNGEVHNVQNVKGQVAEFVNSKFDEFIQFKAGIERNSLNCTCFCWIMINLTNAFTMVEEHFEFQSSEMLQNKRILLYLVVCESY